MSRQSPDPAPNQTPAIDFEVLTNPGTKRWDARADAYALSAKQLGLSVPQITPELCRNGYAVSTAEVVESLNRQGVQNAAGVAEIGFAVLRWDARADAFALAAHRIGQTQVQVLAGLTRAGYGVTLGDVAASLHRQGVRWM